MSTVEQWFPYRRGDGRVELFAFPHAGAASTVFNPLRKALRDDGVALTATVLPGHGKRLRERPHRRMDTLVAEFAEMARRDGYAAFQGDYALLGHCSGSLIAYELAQLLVRAPCRNPRLLVVCSCMPPQMIFDTGMGRLPTRELLVQTAAMGGTPPQLLDDPDFLEVLERPLRADWEMFDGYVQRPDAPKLPVPILAIRGAEDPNCEARFLQRWQEKTTAEFRTAELGEGHWALEDDGSLLLAREIRTALAAVCPA
jgi:surfactin synthase thioesterase subunit